jgi:hypothetical protein
VAFAIGEWTGVLGEVEAENRLAGAQDSADSAGVAIRFGGKLKPRTVAVLGAGSCPGDGVSGMGVGIDECNERVVVEPGLLNNTADLHDKLGTAVSGLRGVTHVRKHFECFGDTVDILRGGVSDRGFAGFGQDSSDGGEELGEIAFTDIVRSAAIQGFQRALLANGAGDEDEGDSGALRAGECESGQAVILWESEVGDNELRIEFVQLGAEVVFGFDPAPGAGEAATGKLPGGEFGVGGMIIDD